MEKSARNNGGIENSFIIPEYKKIKEGHLRLLEGKIIHKKLARKMEGMVGFRNIAVHDYQSLNVEILKSIPGKNMPDLEEFYTTVLRYFGWA